MKRYLMRAPSGAFDNPSYTEVFQNNLIRGNSGNLIFPHSISRVIMTEDVEIDYLNTLNPVTDEEIERINSTYDAFIIPLANAFRRAFVGELNNLTRMVRLMDIPSVVIGVGAKGGKIGTRRDAYVFDEAVRDFCNAVLEKSQIIGVRGEWTASYLKQLGYKEEKDFTIIGCPSMYLYGEDLPEPKELNLSSNSRINLNCKASLPDKIHVYQRKIREQIPDHYYIPQNLYELETVFLGRNILKIVDRLKETHKDFPQDYSHPLYQQNRVRGFVSVKPWLDFLKKGDLNFGTRIHGNIAGILSGVPSFIVVPDKRVLELAQYHNIPHTTIKELDADKDIFHLLDGVDFSSVKSGHRERFQHYLDFLHSNGLATIFDDNSDKNSACKFDRKIEEIDFRPPIVPFIHAPFEDQLEAIRLWEWLIKCEKDKLEAVAAERDNLKKENSDLKKRHCGRISLSIGSRTLNLFKR